MWKLVLIDRASRSLEAKEHMDDDRKKRVFLILCDDVQTTNALVAHVQKALGDVVHAPNLLEALRHLGQCELAAAVLARQPDTPAVATELEANGVPFCVWDQGSAAPVTVVVSDADMVVPTLRALVARGQKKRV